MADTPKTSDDTTPVTPDEDGAAQPYGMNPHLVPEKPADEEATTGEG